MAIEDNVNLEKSEDTLVSLIEGVKVKERVLMPANFQ